VVQDLASELDFFATCVELAGGQLASDRPYDSHSLVPLLRGTGGGSRDEVFYYCDNQLSALRQGPWKLHIRTIEAAAGQIKSRPQSPPLLFNVETDPSERFNVADRHPEVVERLLKIIEAHRASITPGAPQL
jgi:arylsulfatase A-like enzyme